MLTSTMARVRRRVPPRMVIAGVMAGVAAATLVASFVMSRSDFMGLLMATFIGAIYLSPVALLLSRLDLRAVGPATLEVRDEGVVLRAAGEERWVTRAELTGARVLSWPMGATLEVRDKLGARFEAEGVDRRDAHVAVDRLGFDARSHPQTWDLSASPWVSGLIGAFLGCVTAGFAAGLASSALAAALAMALTVAAAVLLRGRTWLRVGADGLQWKHGARGGFVPYTEVTELSLVVRDRHFPAGVRVALRGGGVLELLSRRNHDDRALGAFEHLRHVFETWRVRQKQAAEALLDRGGRSVSEWRDAVRALVDATPGYRGVGMDAESLAQVAEDPAAPPERRVAASLALASQPDARTRIRIAADRSANDPLREAMVAAVEDRLDDDAVERLARRER
ncbi:MAG: hypothetical protein R3A52_22460 [Polyangiales bacterium]